MNPRFQSALNLNYDNLQRTIDKALQDFAILTGSTAAFAGVPPADAARACATVLGTLALEHLRLAVAIRDNAPGTPENLEAEFRRVLDDFRARGA